MMALNLGNEIESQRDTYHERILPMKENKNESTRWMLNCLSSILATLARFSHV
jgi:hypothetical protein